jgi:hypothetical protein
VRGELDVVLREAIGIDALHLAHVRQARVEDGGVRPLLPIGNPELPALPEDPGAVQLEAGIVSEHSRSTVAANPPAVDRP